MLDLMPISLITAYVLFSTFAFYQTLHVKKFRGESQTFGLVLTISSFAAFICGIIFFIYYGWTVRWYLPILLFVTGLVVKTVWFGFEVRLGFEDLPFILSLLGFVVWPAAAVWMFLAVPAGR